MTIRHLLLIHFQSLQVVVKTCFPFDNLKLHCSAVNADFYLLFIVNNNFINVKMHSIVVCFSRFLKMTSKVQSAICVSCLTEVFNVTAATRNEVK